MFRFRQMLIDLDNPTELNRFFQHAVIEKTMLCWEDFQAKELAEKGHEEVKTMQTAAPTASKSSQRDACGDGIGTYMLTKPTLRWLSFPVYYHIDTTNCNWSNKAAAAQALKNAFDSFNYVIKKTSPAAEFQLTTDPNKAKIKVFWALHDGPLGQLAICNWRYLPSRGEFLSATIKFDQKDNWFVNEALQCGYTNSPFDIENCAAHEVGHALGLSHVFNDTRSTLYPTMKRGETLRRSLDAGTVKAMQYLYPSSSSSVTV